MRKTMVKFKDSEIGDELVLFKYNEKKYDFYETMNLTKEVLYLDFYNYSFKELVNECSQLTRRLYNKAIDILQGGDCGVTTDRFCDFMQEAFGWKYEIINADSIFDVEYGEWDYED